MYCIITYLIRLIKICNILIPNNEVEVLELIRIGGNYSEFPFFKRTNIGNLKDLPWFKP